MMQTIITVILSVLATLTFFMAWGLLDRYEMNRCPREKRGYNCRTRIGRDCPECGRKGSLNHEK